jgi:hypothetical protein
MGDRPGSYRTTYYSEPIHYKDTSGEWRDVDTTLVRGANGLTPKATASEVTLAMSSDASALMSVESSDASVASGLVGARPQRVEWSANRARYADVMPGVDIELFAMNRGVKQDLILRSRDVPTTYLFPLELKGVTPAQDPEGQIIFKDGKGNVRFRSPRGWMEDSNVDPHVGEGVRSDGVLYSLATVNGRQAIKVKLDKSWLDDPRRVYPVRVDPTQTFQTHADTFVQNTFPSTDYSADPQLKAGTFNGGTDVVRSYADFPIDADLAGTEATVNQANLKLHNIHSFSCTDSAFRVYRVASSWNPTILRWGNQPTIGAIVREVSFAHGYSSSCPMAWETIDVTPAVRDWASDAVGPFGLMFRAASETSNSGWKKFDSQNNTRGAEYKPKLDVNWYEAAPSVALVSPADGFVSAAAPALVATYNDGDPSDNGMLLFRVYNSAGQLVDSRDTNYYSPGTQLSWTPSVPPGQYTWKVQAFDGANSSPWSGSRSFRIDVAPSVTVVGPANGSASSSAPALTATYNDADPADNGLLRFEVYDNASQLVSSFNTGSYAPGTTRSWTPTVTPGLYIWRVQSFDGSNSSAWSAYRSFRVDVDPPAMPDIVTSTSHDIGVPDPDGVVNASWSWSTDAESGLAGYSWAFTTSASTPADAVSDGNLRSATSPSLANGNWWFHVRGVDLAGNASDDVTVGPYVIDSNAVNLPYIAQAPEDGDESCEPTTYEYDPATCQAPPDPLGTTLPAMDEYRSLYGYNGTHFAPHVDGSSVRVLEETVYSSGTSDWKATGLLRNETSSDVGTVTVLASLRDSNDGELGQATATLPIAMVRRNEPAPFSIEAPIAASQVVRVVWSVLTGPVATAKRKVVLTEHWRLPYGAREKFDDYLIDDPAQAPYPYRLSGSVANEESTALAAPKVTVAWVDSAGRVRGVESVQPSDPDGSVALTIPAGKTRDFEIAISDPDLAVAATQSTDILLWGEGE